MIKGNIEYHKQRLSSAKDIGNRAGEGAAYGNLGNAYQSLGNFEEAIDYHKKHLAIAKELGQRDGEGAAYGNLGNAYQSLGYFRRAVECHRIRLNIAEELGQRDGEGRACGNLGNAYRSLGDFGQAVEYHVRCLSIVKELGQRDGEGRAYGNLGNAYQSLGDFNKAIEYHKQSLSITKELGNKGGEGAAYGNLGIAYQSLGDFRQAIDYHKQHLSIAKELGQRGGEGCAYGNLGNAYQSLGDYMQAVEYHKKHLNIAKEMRQRDGEGAAYCNLGIAYRNLGDLRRAIEYHLQDLSIAKELGQRDGEGKAYANLGNTYDSLGDFRQAIAYHEQHLSISKDLGKRDGEGAAYGNLGNAYHSLGDFEQAIEFHRQRLSIAKELGQRDGEARAYGNLGNVYLGLGDFKTAIEYQKQCLSIVKELGQRDEEGAAYDNLGNAYRRMGDCKQAIEYHKKDLSIAKDLGNKTREGAACYSLGCDLELSGSVHEALNYYQNSVKVYNHVRALLQAKDVWKISFRNACQHAYTALSRTLLRLQKTDEALCVAEQGRAQALVDLMKLNYHSKLQAPEEFVTKGAIFDVLTGLCTQTLFIVLESNTIYLWLLKGTDVHFEKRSIENVNLLKEKVFKQIAVRVDYRECGAEGIDDCTNIPLRLLFNSIIGPIANKLEGDELIIVPDGSLFLVPYAACLDEASSYLSESTRIRIIPSLTSLKLITDSPEDYHHKTGALLVGDPSVKEVKRFRGRRVKFLDLPMRREEVQMIGKILNTEPLTGSNATKDEVLKRIGSVALVHIAAHPTMENGEIALAPNPLRASKNPKYRDFMLTMSDVQAVQLRARLVVLSCAHSAQGEVTAEGVVGIARAFLGAGARSLLVSLWAIDDEATVEFMKSFYKHLADGKSASVALHRAMKCIRESEKFGAVKYWAPFVLIGDDVTIDFGKIRVGAS